MWLGCFEPLGWAGFWVRIKNADAFIVEKCQFLYKRALDGGLREPPKDLDGLGVGRGSLYGRATSFF
jgi:hypothetical protein